MSNPALSCNPASSTEKESARASATRSATTMISNLLRCVLWLISHGIYITGFSGSQRAGVDRVVVTVSPSPYLHRVFAGNCYWSKRRQEGALTIYTWFGERFGIRIEWEEVTSCA